MKSISQSLATNTFTILTGSLTFLIFILMHCSIQLHAADIYKTPSLSSSTDSNSAMDKPTPLSLVASLEEPKPSEILSFYHKGIQAPVYMFTTVEQRTLPNGKTGFFLPRSDDKNPGIFEQFILALLSSCNNDNLICYFPYVWLYRCSTPSGKKYWTHNCDNPEIIKNTGEAQYFSAGDAFKLMQENSPEPLPIPLPRFDD